MWRRPCARAEHEAHQSAVHVSQRNLDDMHAELAAATAP